MFRGFFYILIFWAVMWVKGQKIAQNKKRQLYLSCNISQEQYSLWSWLLVHLCKMMICSGVFLYFHFLGCYAGKRAKNCTKWKWQLYLSCNLPQEQCSLWSWLLVHLCKMIICLSGLFYIFIFWAVMGVKGQEMAQNAKKKCLLHFMYQEPYILWLSFIVDFCKMMISPGFFFHFFEVLKNEKSQLHLSHAISQEHYSIWSRFLVHLC